MSSWEIIGMRMITVIETKNDLCAGNTILDPILLFLRAGYTE